MTEARYYKRLNIDIPCSVYSGTTEVCGKIANICEEGIAVELSDEDYARINPQLNIKLLIQFVDEIVLYTSKTVENILITVNVVHSESIEGGHIIGCLVEESQNASSEYSKYVDLKKAVSFIKSTTSA